MFLLHEKRWRLRTVYDAGQQPKTPLSIRLMCILALALLVLLLLAEQPATAGARPHPPRVLYPPTVPSSSAHGHVSMGPCTNERNEVVQLRYLRYERTADVQDQHMGKNTRVCE